MMADPVPRDERSPLLALGYHVAIDAVSRSNIAATLVPSKRAFIMRDLVLERTREELRAPNEAELHLS